MNKLSLTTDEGKLEILRLRNDKASFSSIEKQTGISRSAAQRFCNKKTYIDWWEEHEKPIASGTIHDHYHNIPKAKETCFIITSGQNSTFVNSNVLSTLETIADHREARLIVGTFSYNLNGFQNLGKGDGEWFDTKFEKYILDEPLLLADDLVYCGELNVLPTADYPLSGFQRYTKNMSAIIPHAKVQMESLPRPKGDKHKMMYTTGTITQRNYIQKKAGQKASFDHVFGALIVEVCKDGNWFVRQLNADQETGEIQDLDVIYKADGTYSEGNRVEAISYGDLHSEKGCSETYAGCFQSVDSMVDVLKPKYQFAHDILDFTSRNHHNINDPYFMFKSYVNGQDRVETDIYTVCNTLRSMQRPFSEVVVVNSNHDRALKRWLATTDFKKDPANAIFYLEASLKLYKAMEIGEEINIFEEVVRERLSNQEGLRFLAVDESFKICGDKGVECGYHGDTGINGTRGGIKHFIRLGMRINIGHSHTAGIIGNVYQGGKSCRDDMGYNTGPTTWNNSHIITYPSGKRCIVTGIGRRWRAV